MKKLALIIGILGIIGIGCSSTKTLSYHQWVPVQIQQSQSQQAQQPATHLKK